MESMISGASARTARKAAGLSQNAIAQAVGINRVYFSLFEQGRYLLDTDEQRKLCEFFSAHEIHPSGALSQAASTSTPATASLQSGPKVLENRDGVDFWEHCDTDDSRVSESIQALDTVRATAETGLRSIRTAAAVTAATDALRALDYVELISIADESGVRTDGLVSMDEFNAFDLASMRLWESRAAGVLVCEALYGRAWQDACFDRLKEIEESLRGGLERGEKLELRERGVGHILFGDAEEFSSRRRADLSPYIVRAAERRRAPTLGKLPVKKNEPAPGA